MAAPRNPYPEIDVLLVTTADLEHDAVSAKMVPQGGAGKCTITRANLGVAFGWMGGYRVALIQTEQGSSGPNAAGSAVQGASEALQPKAIIAVGFAAGVNPNDPKSGKPKDKVRMLDVLVSKRIADYEHRRVQGDEQRVVPRGQISDHAVLLQAFKRTFTGDWTPPHAEARPPLPADHGLDADPGPDEEIDDEQAEKKPRDVKIHQGLILSGNALADSKPFVASLQLVDNFQEAIGLEMEGVGMVAASRGLQCVLVKAVCDFGGVDGPKTKGVQKRAAENAASLVHHVLNQHSLSAELGCTFYGEEDRDATWLEPSPRGAYGQLQVHVIAMGCYEEAPDEVVLCAKIPELRGAKVAYDRAIRDQVAFGSPERPWARWNDDLERAVQRLAQRPRKAELVVLTGGAPLALYTRAGMLLRSNYRVVVYDQRQDRVYRVESSVLRARGMTAAASEPEMFRLESYASETSVPVDMRPCTYLYVSITREYMLNEHKAQAVRAECATIGLIVQSMWQIVPPEPEDGTPASIEVPDDVSEICSALYQAMTQLVTQAPSCHVVVVGSSTPKALSLALGALCYRAFMNQDWDVVLLEKVGSPRQVAWVSAELALQERDPSSSSSS